MFIRKFYAITPATKYNFASKPLNDYFKNLFNKLQLTKFEVCIRFKTNVSFIFYHNVKIYDLLCKAVSNDPGKLGDDLINDAPESGKINTNWGTIYIFLCLEY